MAGISRLTVLCRELCENGILPDDNEIIGYFAEKELNAAETEYLYLAITCVLIEYAVQGIKSGDKKLFENSSLSVGRLDDADHFGFDKAVLALADADLNVFAGQCAGHEGGAAVGKAAYTLHFTADAVDVDDFVHNIAPVQETPEFRGEHPANDW